MWQGMPHSAPVKSAQMQAARQQCHRLTDSNMHVAEPLQYWTDAALLSMGCYKDPPVASWGRRMCLLPCKAMPVRLHACLCQAYLLRGCTFACIHLQQALHTVLGGITDLGPGFTLEVQLALQHLQAPTNSCRLQHSI